MRIVLESEFIKVCVEIAVGLIKQQPDPSGELSLLLLLLPIGHSSKCCQPIGGLVWGILCFFSENLPPGPYSGSTSIVLKPCCHSPKLALARHDRPGPVVEGGERDALWAALGARATTIGAECFCCYCWLLPTGQQLVEIDVRCGLCFELRKDLAVARKIN